MDKKDLKHNDNRNPRNLFSNLARKLTKLFSGPIVNHDRQTPRRLRRRDLDSKAPWIKSAAGVPFKKSSFNPYEKLNLAYFNNYNRADRYIDFDQMEYCLHGDTKIAVPDGYKTLKELSDEYGLNETFIVYAYDHNKQEIVPAIGRQARKTKTDHAWKVTFENGQSIIGTADHRLMMKDGTYLTIEELNVGDALMPFYRKDLINSKKDSGKGYRWVYTNHKDVGRRPGWIAEHILIAEWANNCRLNQNEVVHHKNFIKFDNNPHNLEIMDNDAHLKFHQKILNEQRKKTGWWKKFAQNHSQWMKKNNPAKRNDITFDLILEKSLKYNFSQKDVCKTFDTDRMTILRRIKSKGFSSWTDFARTYVHGWSPDYSAHGKKNPRYDHSLTYQDVCNAYRAGDTLKNVALKLQTTEMKVIGRIKLQGYDSYTNWVQEYHNHKVSKIEYHGIVDLYDMTVDEYHNFATDTVISHNCVEIATALDIYADEITTSNDLQELLTIKCPNQEVKIVLQNLFKNILNIEHNLFYWARTLCKYGDFFLYLDVDEKEGVKHVIGLPTAEVERIEGKDEKNPNYVIFQWNSANMTFENWQMAHFRILGNDKFHPYGMAVLDPARRIFRQLDLLENAMMAYRIVRSPERRVFYIDVGHIEADDIEQYMLEMQTSLKKHKLTDPESGRIDTRYNPLSVESDYYIPVRGKDRGTKIDTLPGGNWTGDVDDVEYLRKKLLTALKIPGEYLMNSEDGGSQQSSLAQKDIRFARTIQRIQKILISELKKIAQVHLFTLGYRGNDLENFKLSLNNPSQLAELQHLESWRTKFEVAAAANEGFFSRSWVYENIFGITKENVRKIEIERYTDKKIDTLYDLVGEEIAADSGLGVNELDDISSLGDELGAPGLQGTAADVGSDGQQGGALMAAPGKRDVTTTPRSKGKLYSPVVNDSRQSGARNRHYSALAGNNHIGRSEKSRLPGLQSLRRVGMGTAAESLDKEFDMLLEKNLKFVKSADEIDVVEMMTPTKKASTYNDELIANNEEILNEEIKDLKELTILIERNISKETMKRREFIVEVDDEEAEA